MDDSSLDCSLAGTAGLTWIRGKSVGIGIGLLPELSLSWSRRCTASVGIETSRLEGGKTGRRWRIREGLLGGREREREKKRKGKTKRREKEQQAASRSPRTKQQQSKLPGLPPRIKKEK